jgi:diguanylate cyclase (GGDEF)-like protein/PAS domain S-box-containing protein
MHTNEDLLHVPVPDRRIAEGRRVSRLRERWARRPHAGPAVRIGLGLSALVVALLLVADIVFRVFPNPAAVLAEQRSRSTEQLALQSIALLELAPESSIAGTFERVLARAEDIARIRLERADGKAVFDRRGAGVEARDAGALEAAYQVPLLTREGPWGRLAVWYRDAPATGLSAVLDNPFLRLVAGLGLVCFVTFALYLRRVLSHLDPSSVVPARIRQVFDVFSSGIVVVDRHAVILLANQRFGMFGGEVEGTPLTGQQLHRLPALARALSEDPASHPWALAMETGEPLTGARMDARHTDGSLRKLLVSSAPIDDGDGRVRGCLISFEDITPVVDLNEQLERSNADLVRSKQDIEQMNAELVRIATRDPLTGVFNRRALFDSGEPLFAQARSENLALCCIMVDIDHFKRFNDDHGHATGDEVLRAVTRLLTAGLRDRDLLARYGGEEFCIVLPGAALPTALAIAERLRESVETLAGGAVREPRGLRVTASFGVSTVEPGTTHFEALIHRADQALYASKGAGRNRVTSAADL